MIGDKIKQERLKRDITQGELGKVIDVSPSTIGMYEQNRRQPDISTLIKIADYFNVTTDYLLGRVDDDPSKSLNECETGEIITLAAHHDGEEFTKEELDYIEAFKKLAKARKMNK